MKIKVDIISQELVKPSSPTPHHLGHLEFSFIDQLQPQVSIPFVHFYSNGSTLSKLQKCHLLKKSLSKVLTVFYPLAGRVRNESYADCNDEGFLFVEAKASCRLDDVLRERNPYNNDLFTRFRPEESGELAAYCQITWFECQGFALSFGMCHKLGDALSMFVFLNSWAAMARGDTEAIPAPSFGHASTFPSINIPKFDYMPMFSKEKLVTKNFVFDRESLEDLKAKHTTFKGNGRRLSRVEVLTGFILGRYIATTRTQTANNMECSVMHAMDLRPRMEPPMPKLSFGNIGTAAIIETRINAEDEYCFGIAERIRDSATNSAEYLKKHRDNLYNVWNFLKRTMETYFKRDVVSFSFSSLTKFPAYETDFGWGKPLWVGATPLIAKNLAYFMGAKDGEGIEAWISLKEEEMAMFEADKQIFSYASSSSYGRLLDFNSRL